MGVADGVPVGPLQREYLRQLSLGLFSESEFAQWIGYCQQARFGGHGDVTRLRRTLGLMKQSGGLKSINKHMRYDTAVKITKALNLDPVDMGV